MSLWNPLGMLDDKKACKWILYLPQTLARDFCNASFYLHNEIAISKFGYFGQFWGLYAVGPRGKVVPMERSYRKLAHQLVGELVAGFPDSRILPHPQ